MFQALKKESEGFQKLTRRILKYHFDWQPTKPTQNARRKQLREWIEEYAKERRRR